MKFFSENVQFFNDIPNPSASEHNVQCLMADQSPPIHTFHVDTTHVSLLFSHGSQISHRMTTLKVRKNKYLHIPFSGLASYIYGWTRVDVVSKIKCEYISMSVGHRIGL